MKIFAYFDFLDYLILLGIFFIVVALVALDFKRRLRVLKSGRKTRIYLILGGLMLLTASLFLLMGLEKNAGATAFEILKPVAIMTSEPYVIMGCTGVFIGFGLLLSSMWRKGG